MCVERMYFGNTGITPELPDIEFPDNDIQNVLELAQTIAALRGANVMSVEVGVRMALPDWSQEQVDDEVQQVMEETGLEVAQHAKIAMATPLGDTLSQDIAALATPTPEPKPTPNPDDDTATVDSDDSPNSG